MNLAEGLSAYFLLNTLIALGAILIFGGLWICEKVQIKVNAQSKLELNYFVLIMIFIVCGMSPFLPKTDFYQPVAKIWSSESADMFYNQNQNLTQAGYFSVSVENKKPIFIQSEVMLQFFVTLFLIVIFLGFVFMCKDLWKIHRIEKDSLIYKKIGGVIIYLNDQISVPFSYRTTKACVVIPTFLLTDLSDFKISVAHEIQHHRQNDTFWVYILWALKLFCFLNPFLYLWIRQISEIQEFACDEALIGQKKIESQAYANCLLRVVLTASHNDCQLVGTTGMAFYCDRQLLKRRIESMFQKTQKINNFTKMIMMSFIVTGLALAAYASKGLIQDRRVTMKEALGFAKQAQNNSAFPIVVNDLVLKELNRYIGTPEGREFMQKALVRMQHYRPMISEKLTQYQLPEELLAIPIIESGYQNLPQSENKTWGAGLWMFIKPTAINYGLQVDDIKDERLNPEVLTDAAMRYLSSNYNRFRNWPLAALAYNIGENKVQEGLDKLNTRDAWVLHRNGYQGEIYLPRLMAAILIMRNPDSVN